MATSAHLNKYAARILSGVNLSFANMLLPCRDADLHAWVGLELSRPTAPSAADPRNVSSQASSFDVAPAVELMKMPNSMCRSPLGGYQSSGTGSSIQVPAGYDSRTIENAAFADDISPHSDVRSSMRSSPLGRPMVTMEAAMNDVEFASADSLLSSLSQVSPLTSPSGSAPPDPDVEVFMSGADGKTPDGLAAEAEAKAAAQAALAGPDAVFSPVAKTASAGSSGSGTDGPVLSPSFMTPTGSTPSFFRDSAGGIDTFAWTASQEGSSTGSRTADDVVAAAQAPGFAAVELASPIPEDAPLEGGRARRPATGDAVEQASMEDSGAGGPSETDRSIPAKVEGSRPAAQDPGASSGELVDLVMSVTDETVGSKLADDGGAVVGSSTELTEVSAMDGSGGMYVDADTSKTSLDVSGSCVSLMCPQIFTDGGRFDGGNAQLPPVWPPPAGATASSPPPPQMEAASLSLAEHLPMHGDITDSDELGSGLMGTAAGHTAPVSEQMDVLGRGSGTAGVYFPSDGLHLSPSSNDGVFMPGKGSAAPLESVMDGRGVRFRMDGDMGLKSCVRVLFLASQQARSTIGEEMSQVLVDHGVVSAQDMQEAC